MVQVYFGQNRKGIPVGMESALWVSVKVRGAEGDRMQVSGGLSHFVLIDCSGSMKGEKIEAAKEALRQYVNILGDDDDLTVIGFGIWGNSGDYYDEDNSVKTLFLHKKMDHDGKEDVLRRVESLSAKGDTPLYGAILKFTTLSRDSERNTSFVLLTDGQATDNDNPDAYVELLKKMAETISRSYVMGIGSDYDERILIAIKNATNGQFEHIDMPSEVVGKFQEISTKSRMIVVKSPRMLIKLTNGARLVGIYRVEPQIQELTGQLKQTESGELEAFMPDLVADEDQQYAMMIAMPARPEGDYREARIRFIGFDYSPYDVVVGRSSQPNSNVEADPAPRLLYVQTKERWIAQKALSGDRSAIEETQRILESYQNNPDKEKTMPISHVQDLEKVTQLVSAGSSADSETKKQVTAKLTKRVEK